MNKLKSDLESKTIEAKLDMDKITKMMKDISVQSNQSDKNDVRSTLTKWSSMHSVQSADSVQPKFVTYLSRGNTDDLPQYASRHSRKIMDLTPSNSFNPMDIEQNNDKHNKIQSVDVKKLQRQRTGGDIFDDAMATE